MNGLTLLGMVMGYCLVQEPARAGVKDTREQPAEGAENVWTAHPFVPTLHLGIATPYGALGVALDVSPAGWLAFEAGGGLGSGGPQLATLGRIRAIMSSHTALSFGTGLSMGPYVSNSETEGVLSIMNSMGHNPPDKKVWDWAYWHNVELSAERRPRDRSPGIAVRGYAGFGYVLNPRDYSCEENQGYGCGELQGAMLLYIGVGLGLPL